MPQNYRFIELPNKTNPPKKEELYPRKERRKAKLHNLYAHTNLSGKIKLKLLVRTSLTVNSGVMVLGSDLARNIKDQKVADRLSAKKGLIQAAVQKQDRLIIPGSSLKGVLRSVYETITQSCLCKLDRNYKKNVEPPFQECKVNPKNEKISVCPACRVFGAMSYSGLIRFEDAIRNRPGFALTTVPTSNSPNPNAQDPITGEKIYFDNQKIILPPNDRKNEAAQPRLNGRKFYPHSQVLKSQGVIATQSAKAGSVFNTSIHLSNVTKVELGSLFIALGLDQRYPFSLKIGSGKAYGKGTVTVEIQEIDVCQNLKDLKARYSQYQSESHLISDSNKIRDYVQLLAQEALPLETSSNKNLVKEEALQQIADILKWPLENK